MFKIMFNNMGNINIKSKNIDKYDDNINLIDSYEIVDDSRWVIYNKRESVIYNNMISIRYHPSTL